MSENYSDILDRLLYEIPEEQDTRESTVTYQILAAAAVEIKNAYDMNDVTLLETFADTATMEGLKRRASERGLEPKPATQTVVKGEFDTDIPIGSRFFKDDFTYRVAELISGTSYIMVCEQYGSGANGYVGEITPIEDIENLTSARITEILIPGEDEQETEDFRREYFESFKNISYGWNKAMYISYVNDIPGVGGVVVLPHTNSSMETEGGHVTLVIESATFDIPSNELLSTIKQKLDPTDGNGDGVVSIDHNVHCRACGKTIINITSNITYEQGYSFGMLKSEIEKKIDDYFTALNKEWESGGIVVRIAKIQSALIEIVGILDVTNTTINGSSSSVEIDRLNIIERGVING